MSKQTHYYSRTQGKVVERVNNPTWQAGSKAGYRQRRKDQTADCYPREGLPLAEDKPDDWVRGYQASYYQHRSVGAPMLGDTPKVQITVRVDRSINSAAQEINKSQWAELGLRLGIAGVDQASLEQMISDLQSIND